MYKQYLESNNPQGLKYYKNKPNLNYTPTYISKALAE